MAASASSSQFPCEKYDVFISFRGSDTRSGFLSHLTKELRREDIDVYVDDRLQRGKEISSALEKAIEGSMIALVIFSKDYASSRWCLEELVKIMQCKETGQQIVIPVFYDLDPSDVRHQKGTYAEAFTLHEKTFMDKVEIWLVMIHRNFNESKLIDAIVEDVLKNLEDNSPIVPNSQFIGFHQNFTIVESLMEITSQEVRLVGIWGMGGIGKTTLARAIFDRFLSEFASYCFLENVREKSTKVDGLNSLRDELLSKLLGQKHHKNNALRRLQRKKVLISLDDVDNPKQLKVLVGCLQLGLGSRVIVTSRDKHVLRSGGIHDQFIHGVNELSFQESLELFSIHAFNQSQPKEGYEKLSQKTLDIAKGIPLALEVLGSHFHSRDKAYWESELRKLKKNSHEQIQNILKISYDGLDATDKDIFLDIAFFFIGEKKDKITCGLEACGFEAISGIQNLIDKALIKLDWNGRIVMHDLIREMAEQIVRDEESMRHPERRSRLKDADEIYDVLKNNMGTDKIEGIILDVSRIKYVQVEADIFVKMKNLRFLKFFHPQMVWTVDSRYIDLLSDLDPFSNKLRYLHWDHYPLETLPLGSYLENLVELHMQRSDVKRLWAGKQDLGNLKTINLRRSYELIELPDLSMAHKLESVDLQGCTNLRSVHPSILSLPSIIEMNISSCSKLEIIESETHLESFFDLSADYCCLKKLCLSLNDSAVETLPACVNHLSSLKFIYLKRCKRLKSILGLPPFLQLLDASECTSLETISSDSRVWNKCVFNFCDCEKMDERSLCYIQELIHFSMTSASGCYNYNDDDITCYPGSRVPEWMEYKPMTEAFNATEFTCNLERSHDLLICCVAPSFLVSKQLSVFCHFSYDDNKEFRSSRTFCAALNRDHVLLWPVRSSSYDAGIGNDAKISCEFFLEYWDEEGGDYGDDEEGDYWGYEEGDYGDEEVDYWGYEEGDYGDDEEGDYWGYEEVDYEDDDVGDYWDYGKGAYCAVPAKACGAHLIYYS